MHIISEFSSNDGRSLETYRGQVWSIKDTLLIFEGIRLGILHKVSRRLDDRERQLIGPNMVFAWNESECGMKRWTDGKSWSTSKVQGPFLVYTELDETKSVARKGLVKQSFSLKTKQNEKLHLIAYLDPEDNLPCRVPSSDPLLQTLHISPSVYHSSHLLIDDLAKENSCAFRFSSLPGSTRESYSSVSPSAKVAYLPPPTRMYYSWAVPGNNPPQRAEPNYQHSPSQLNYADQYSFQPNTSGLPRTLGPLVRPSNGARYSSYNYNSDDTQILHTLDKSFRT